MHLAAADIVTVQNPNGKSVSSGSLPGSSVQLWNPLQMSSSATFGHHELISPHTESAVRGVGGGRSMMQNGNELVHHEANASAAGFSHLHMANAYGAQHDDDTIVSMDGDRSCYSR